VGGGIDINLGQRFAIRAFQADYIMTRYKTGARQFFSGFDEQQNNYRNCLAK
jgi:hypothetical protein